MSIDQQLYHFNHPQSLWYPCIAVDLCTQIKTILNGSPSDFWHFGRQQIFWWRIKSAKLTNWTARCVAVSGDCDSFNIVIICCKPSGCGSHVIFSVFYFSLFFHSLSLSLSFLGFSLYEIGIFLFCAIIY